MLEIKHELECNGEPILLKPMSDLHIGDRRSDYKLIINTRDEILNTDNMYTILNGDLINNAIAGSKSDFYNESMTPMDELRKAVEIFGPLADAGKILAITNGNHEERTSRQVGLEITKLIALQLGLEHLYSPTSAYLYLKFGANNRRRDGRKMVYTVYCNHGAAGGGRRPGGKINALEDFGKIVVADLYVVGHTHLPMTFREKIKVPNKNNMTSTWMDRVFVNTASFMEYDDSYGDRMAYVPNSTKTPVVKLDNMKYQIEVTL